MKQLAPKVIEMVPCTCGVHYVMVGRQCEHRTPVSAPQVIARATYVRDAYSPTFSWAYNAYVNSI